MLQAETEWLDRLASVGCICPYRFVYGAGPRPTAPGDVRDNVAEKGTIPGVLCGFSARNARDPSESHHKHSRPPTHSWEELISRFTPIAASRPPNLTGGVVLKILAPPLPGVSEVTRAVVSRVSNRGQSDVRLVPQQRQVM